jgi:hypothetical protein
MCGAVVIACFGEFPKNILGTIMFIVYRATGSICKIERIDGRFVIEISSDGAVSMGIFFHTKHDRAIVPVGLENRAHEWGHSVQSRMFGPLYLLLVGVPSVLRVLYATA